MIPAEKAPEHRVRPIWPPDMAGELRKRIVSLNRVRENPHALAIALAQCEHDPVTFISEWCWTQDPRPAAVGGMTTLPFVLFPRQEDFVRWVVGRLEAQDDGLCEKARELGLTWLCAAISIWLWRFVPGASVGFGSRKQDLVDRKGDMDSIFEKIRFIIDNLPDEFLPDGFDRRKHCTFMKILNPANGASITGEAGDEIGRGGRKTIYFKDESAHYERPMLIEASLSQNTNCQIDISSVSGTGTPFHQKRVSWPAEKIFIFDWREDPRKDQAWYDDQVSKRPAFVVAQEIDRDYGASTEGGVIDSKWIQAAIKLKLKGSGDKIAGFDVADDGADSHSLVARHGHSFFHVSIWNKGGATAATRTAYAKGKLLGISEIRYEKIGVGAASKGVGEDLSKHRPRIIGTNPANTHLPGWYRLPKNGDKGIKNADMFLNERAMRWWLLRDRFERTFEHVNGTKTYEDDDLISLSELVDQEGFTTLISELSQPQFTVTEAGKIKIIKTPKGCKSPNAADGVMISYMQPKTITGVW